MEVTVGFLDRFVSRSARSTEARALPPVHPSYGPRFAVIDVETTGLSADSHRVLEVAVITADPWGRVLDEWTTRLNPQGPVGATHIHGIQDADVANAPTFEQIIEGLNQRLAGAAVVAHHASFDLAFLRAEYRRAGWQMPSLPALCTLEASEYHFPTLDRRRLADCCWAAGVQLEGAHSALGDARATTQLLSVYMHPHAGVTPLPEHVALPTEALEVVWPSGPTFAVERRVAATVQPPRQDLSDRALSEIGRKSREGSPPPLTYLVAEEFSLIDALDEGAPPGSLAYLEKLAEVLEDGEVTAEEAAELATVADAENLSTDEISAANQAFVLALAHAALEDGKVSRAEKAELLAMAELLGVNERVVPALLDQAEHARDTRLSADLKDLPAEWAHGVPLRVGDKVVFTGCDPDLRTHLEDRSSELGVRIIGSVSPKVALLVSDNSMDGTKAARARELSTRILHPNTYATLLDHLQPALPRVVRNIPKTRPVPTGKHEAGQDPVVPVVVGPSPQSEALVAVLGPNPAVVRAWARANGLEVGVRGRIHQGVTDAYVAAHLDSEEA